MSLLSIIFFLLFELILCCWATEDESKLFTFSFFKEMEAVSLRAINGVGHKDDTDVLRSNRSVIPLILHQSWKTIDIQTHSVAALKCKGLLEKYAAEFTRVLWTDADLIILIKTYYPQYLEYYQNLNMNIKRADFSRYLVIHKFGGLYMDLDIELKKPLIELLNIFVTNKTSMAIENNTLQFISYMKGVELHKKTYAGNSFFGAVAGHPIITNMINHTMAYKNQKSNDSRDVYAHSGPIGLGQVVRLYMDGLQQSDRGGILLLNRSLVGNVANNPSHAVHLRKHKWTRI